MPLLEALMPGVARLLEKGRFPEERRIAICVMDDILEHAPQGAAKYMGQVGARYFMVDLTKGHDASWTTSWSTRHRGRPRTWGMCGRLVGRFGFLWVERSKAICAMDDILEHAPQGAAKDMGQVGGIFFKFFRRGPLYVMDDILGVLRAIVWGGVEGRGAFCALCWVVGLRAAGMVATRRVTPLTHRLTLPSAPAGHAGAAAGLLRQGHGHQAVQVGDTVKGGAEWGRWG